MPLTRRVLLACLARAAAQGTTMCARVVGLRCERDGGGSLNSAREWGTRESEVPRKGRSLASVPVPRVYLMRNVAVMATIVSSAARQTSARHGATARRSCQKFSGWSRLDGASTGVGIPDIPIAGVDNERTGARPSQVHPWPRDLHPLALQAAACSQSL
jgi:hypothetical protein